MAEVLTIIGATSAIANLIDLVWKTSKKVEEILVRWDDATHTYLNLLLQLSGMKLALQEIQRWMASRQDEDDQSYQLTMDLDTSLKCCDMLIRRVQSELSSIHINLDGTVDTASRMLITIQGKKLEEVQKLLERQIGVLNLILSACS
jgi:hypothetical protein